MRDFLHKLLKIPYLLSSIKQGNWSDKGLPVLVLVHGIGVNHKIWQEVVDELPDIPILAVDLLGFGDSRKPDWLDYDTSDHAKSLARTIQRRVGRRKIILCGHSLGSLISIHYISHFNHNVQHLMLCSPPIYKTGSKSQLPPPEDILKFVGKKFLKAIESSKKAAVAANQYKIRQKNFKIDPDNISPYSKTARNSIIKQSAISELSAMKQPPVEIIYGNLDGLMFPSNFKSLARKNSNIKVTSLVAGHEINKRYAALIARMINNHYNPN